MATRRVGLRGRTIVAIVLGASLFVATSVIWRRSRGSAAAQELHTLGTRVTDLEAQRAQLETDIRRASSLERLAPVVQRFGMRIPSDSQVITLPSQPAKEH